MKKYIYVVLTLVAIMAVAVYAQQPKASTTGGHEHHMKAEGGEKHADMTAKHAEMKAKMEAMNAKLDSLVASMNAATGDAKVNAMAAVINELVSQRSQMHSQMMGMHGSMSGCCKMEGKDHDAAGMKGMEGCAMHKASK